MVYAVLKSTDCRQELEKEKGKVGNVLLLLLAPPVPGLPELLLRCRLLSRLVRRSRAARPGLARRHLITPVSDAWLPLLPGPARPETGASRRLSGLSRAPLITLGQLDGNTATLQATLVPTGEPAGLLLRTLRMESLTEPYTSPAPTAENLSTCGAGGGRGLSCCACRSPPERRAVPDRPAAARMASAPWPGCWCRCKGS